LTHTGLVRPSLSFTTSASMALDKRMAVLFFLLQSQAAISGSSSLKSEFGTAVSAKGSLSHTMLLKQAQQQKRQLMRRKEHSLGDDIKNFDLNQSDLQSFADLDEGLHASESKDWDLMTESAELGDDSLVKKDTDKLLDSSKDSDATSTSAGSDDDGVQQTMALAALQRGAEDAKTGDLMTSLKADMAADNDAQTPEKDDSHDLHQSLVTLDKEDSSFDSINADLHKLHKSIYGTDSKANSKDGSSLNSSALQVSAAQQASDWLDTQLGELGPQNTTEAHSWLDAEYEKLQKKTANR